MDPYRVGFSPYIGMANSPISSVDLDGGKTDDPPRMLDEVTVRATRLPSFWQGMKSSLSRADAWFSGRGGMQLAQTIADMNPLMSVAHLASQAREGTNAYGKKMSGMDIASKAADLVPFGAAANVGRKGLLMLGKGVGRLWKAGRAARASTQSFKSFSAFKRAMGPAGKGKAWHHIVEQNPANIAKFGPEAIHNTGNLMKLPHGAGTIHAKISGHYSSIQGFTGGKTVRQWLNTRSFDFQRNYGLQKLKEFAWTP